MEKAYHNLVYLFAAIFLIVIIGFYRTYFGLFPKFENVSSVIHFHAIALMLWSFLIIAQPLLIRYKKLAIHRTLGKLSYFLAPIIVFTTLALTRYKFFERQGSVPLSENLSTLFPPFSHMFLFSLFYILAIVYKKTSYIHMRYMIVASFVVLAPAIVRIDFSWTGIEFDGLIFSFVFTDLLIAILIIFDWLNKKIYKPYFIALALFIIVHFSTFYLTETQFWQSIAAKMVQIFF
jgi:hypothetical protein